jgi:serine/threonine-protein kinase
MTAILNEEPSDISSSGVEAPPELAGTIRRCLEKRSQARFQSASDLAYNLRTISSASTPSAARDAPSQTWRGKRTTWVAAAAAILVAGSVAVWLSRSGPVEKPDAETLPRIAVLPFDNLGSPDDEYFADGMTDEVRGRLFNLAGLEVIARYSSDQFRGSTKTLDQIAGPELVEVRPDATPVAMWHDVFDATLADVFQVQTDIATRVARALDVTLGAGEEKALESRPTDNLAAYDAYLQAERIEREGAGGDYESRMTELYRKAVALDPDFALAWAMLSIMESERYRVFAQTAQNAESARRAAERALELDPSLPEARYAMALYLFDVEYDMEGADEQIALGLETAPNHPLFRHWWAFFHLSMQDQVAYCERAAELDPLSWLAAMDTGIRFLYSRQYQKAQEWLDRAISLAAPTNVVSVDYRAIACLAQGDLEGAKTLVREARERVDVTELVVVFALNFSLYWVLDDDLQDLMFRLGPEQFLGFNNIARSLTFAHTHHLRGEWDQMRADAEIVRAEIEQELESLPDDPKLQIGLGSALAYLGRGEEAVAHGRRGLDLLPDDWLEKPYWTLQLVRIHLILGQPEPALDLLEPLLEVPGYLSPGWLSIDPMFGFRALLEKYDTD